MSTPTPEQAEAERHYVEGERRYDLGDYALAAREFERAYELSGISDLLFDIGQAHRLAGPDHCAAARRSYMGYLRKSPGSAHRAEVLARLEELGVCPPSPPVASAVPASQSAVRVAPPVSSAGSALPSVITGASAVVLVAGGIMYWQARVKYDEVAPSCPCPEGKFDGWQRLAYASYALLAVGAAGTALGVTLWATGPRSNTTSVALSPSGVVLRGTL